MTTVIKVNLVPISGDPYIKLIGVNSSKNEIANQAIMYKNKVKYAGLMNLQITMYFLPKSRNPRIKIIQKEKENAVLRKNGFPK